MKHFLSLLISFLPIIGYAQIDINDEVYESNCKNTANAIINVKNLKVSGVSGACVGLYSTQYIEIDGFMDAEWGSTFDARIVADLNNIPNTVVVDNGTPTVPTPTNPEPTNPTPTNPTPTDPTPTNPTPPTSFDYTYGWVGNVYYSDYWAEYNNLTGVSEFRFYGQDGTNYPAPAYTPVGEKLVKNGLYVISLPTHSVTSNYYGGTNNIISKVKMELYDSSGKLVWSLDEQRGGFHPQYGANRRGNNHPDFSRRWIKPDIYTLKYWNKSDNPSQTSQRFEFWNGQSKLMNLQVGDANMKVYTLDMRYLNDEYHSFKLNCNYY